MTVQETVRRRERRQLIAKLPRHLAGALIATLVGAGALLGVLWAVNPGPDAMRHEEAAQLDHSEPTGIYASLDPRIEPASWRVAKLAP